MRPPDPGGKTNLRPAETSSDMNHNELGFDGWFQQRLEESGAPELHAARVTAVDRDRYLVRNEKTELPAELTGRFRFAAESNLDLPCVGDWVMVQYYDEGQLAIIHTLLPRKSVLRRKSPGRTVDYQLIAANIDTAFIVQACEFDFNLRRLERYLVMVNETGIEPVLLLSKSDLLEPEELEQRISSVRRAGFDGLTLGINALTEHGLEPVHRILEKGKTYCLLGSSGVGKTTLLNHLVGQEAFETRTIREKDGKGRHATTRRHLIVLENGAMLIDNPGMRELGIIDVADSIDETFSDIHDAAERCRFRDCTHTGEKDCAILLAVENGELDEDRYQSFLKLRKESAYHEMSYVEKRQKDRKLGKFYRSVLKGKKDRR